MTADSITRSTTGCGATGTGEYAPIPPVFGPGVAVSDALEVLRRRERAGGVGIAVAHARGARSPAR